MSGATICRVIKTPHEQGGEADTKHLPHPDEELVVKTVILTNDILAKREPKPWASKWKAKLGAEG
jgi:hypothetical protein